MLKLLRTLRHNRDLFRIGYKLALADKRHPSKTHCYATYSHDRKTVFVRVDGEFFSKPASTVGFLELFPAFYTDLDDVYIVDRSYMEIPSN